MQTVFLSSQLLSIIPSVKDPTFSHETKSDPGREWNARLFTVNRRKCVLVTHKITLYSFVRVGISKKDLQNFSASFLPWLLAQLETDGFKSDCKTLFGLKDKEDIFCRKTDNDRSVIGSMNELSYRTKLFLTGEITNTDPDIHRACGGYLNNFPLGALKFLTPNQMCQKLLQSPRELSWLV